ncbi:hypothetical protein BHE74_00048501 [Ensete ventricosum]|nr:hypothetical protein GW17_00041825 [Ensete ventricosum]RWW45638.1 hypothetical protein BHE74_00048501 [Ensete ventricosum]
MGAYREFAEGDQEAHWEHAGNSSEDDRETHQKFVGECREARLDLERSFDISITNDCN